MRTRWPLFLGASVVAFLAATFPATAQVWCGDIACYIPPRAYCSQECLTCGPNSGTEYPDGTCQYPIVISVGDIGCPCYSRQAEEPAKPVDKATAPSVTAEGKVDFAALLEPQPLRCSSR